MRRMVMAATMGLVLVIAGAGVAAAQNFTGDDEPNQITGTEEADTIRALGGQDEVDALGGPDTIYGGSDSDNLCGQGGDDTYHGGFGNDVLLDGQGSCQGGPTTATGSTVSGDGENTMLGGPGTDLILGGNESDTIRGGRNSDCILVLFGIGLLGGSGNDRIYGGKGNDCLAGDEGIDELYGGRGDDQIDSRETGGIGIAGPTLVAGDYVDCGPGFDRAIVDPDDIVVNCEEVDMEPAPTSPGFQRARAQVIRAWMATNR